MAYHRSHQLETRIVRIFNTFGPRMRLSDGRVVPAFIDQALQGQPLTVFGTGAQTRSFSYVDNTVEGIWRLLNSKEHEPVNIGATSEMTILEFAEKIREVVGGASEIIRKELPEDDPKTRCPDLAKAKKVLGWEPSVSFEEGLARTIEYFRHLKNK